jgi:glycosyltransferase involved in cell wall biosynthesis
MNAAPSATLIIATYNWPAALQLCLESILRQSVMPGEIIIADDGSTGSTKEVIDDFSKRCPVAVIHIWQEDEGFQLAKIRNKGFARASQPYLIQIDGDLILHPEFIRDHVQLAEPGFFVTGSRVLLSEENSKSLVEKKPVDIKPFLTNNKNFFNGLHSSLLRNFLATRYKQAGKNKYYVKGCNMAFWKKDIVAVNGYNEAFTGWGREDNEIAIRLMNKGCKKKFLKFGGITYHLYHHEVVRDNLAKNDRLLQQAITEKTTYCAKGIDQYLAS